MIFQHTLQQVLAGTKTQTRRLSKPEHAAVRDDAGTITAVTHNGRVKWRVGGTYAVQPSRNAAGVARIRVTSLHREAAQSISHDDAVAEGYTDAAAFRAGWTRIHGADKLDALVWAIEFELVDPAG
jgi:hypothetical protein